VGDPRVQAALTRLTAGVSATTDEQVRITEIPAPPFQEKVRGHYLAKLLSDAGLAVHTDEVGNVIGSRAGRSGNDLVLVAAHLDTVFPAGTDVRTRREGGRIYAPGISDNGTGLAALVAVARAMREAKIETRSTILFVADVGEEGEGNLRGMRQLVETYRRQLRFVIALDGAATDYVSAAGLASRRVEVTLTGPGGHSWSDFGAPNPIHALARGIARFVKTPVPEVPRTSFNVGEIEGGTSVNSIPARAALKVDLRSESDEELAKIESALRLSMQAGLDEEMAASRKQGVPGAQTLGMEFRVLGIRPGGELADNSSLLSSLRAADDYLGNRSRIERSSTDANIPLSLGVPAIALGAGGRSANAHSLGEWYDPAGREMGLRRVLLTILGVAGVELE
jgi:acetylornithine deacetylase/succinyl-diaminopimelate desuccinylase-like protein